MNQRYRRLRLSSKAADSTNEHVAHRAGKSTSPLRFALKRVLGRKVELVFAFSWAIVFVLIPMQIPVLTGALVNGALGKSASLYGLVTAQGKSLIQDSVIGLIIVSAAYGISGFFRTTSTARLSRYFLSDIRNDMMRKAEYLSLDQHSKLGSGELLNRVIVDTQSARPFVDRVLVGMTTNVLRIVYPAALIFLISPQIGAIAGSVLAVQLLLNWHLQKKLRRATRIVRKTQGKLTSRAKENLDGIETIQISNAEYPTISQFVGESNKLAREQLIAQKYSGLVAAAAMGLTTVGLAFTWWWGGIEMMSGRMTMGTLVTLTGFTVLLYTPSRNFSRLANRYHKGMVAFERIQEVMDFTPSVTEIPNAPDIRITEGIIEFRRVSFSYAEESQAALAEVNLKIPPRKLTAVTGRNGSGKSTLLKLLLRLYDPTKGDILIDGQAIRNVSLKSLRSNIAVVPQNPALFSGTVYENVCFGLPDATAKEIEDACGLANSLDFIRQLKNGFNTRLGQRGGIILSPGQAQRIAIARAILRRPKILLMDEPLSALDVESEEAISSAMDNLKESMTIVVVTHDSKTSSAADRILVMKSGRLAKITERDACEKTEEEIPDKDQSLSPLGTMIVGSKSAKLAKRRKTGT